jgi:hypothetical protein
MKDALVGVSVGVVTATVVMSFMGIVVPLLIKLALLWAKFLGL